MGGSTFNVVWDGTHNFFQVLDSLSNPVLGKQSSLQLFVAHRLTTFVLPKTTQYGENDVIVGARL